MESLLHDLRFGLRGLRRTPAWTVVVVLSLALGIAANLLVFALVDAVVLRPLPLDDADQLLAVFTGSSADPYRPATWAEFVDLQRLGNAVFSDVAASRSFAMSVAAQGRQPRRVTGELISTNYFEVLGLEMTGPGFNTAPRTGSDRGLEVVIGHALWQRAFGGEPDLVGRAVDLNGHTHLVVGIAPAGFYGLDLARRVELWAPAGAWDHLAPPFWANFDGANENAQRSAERVALWRLTGRLQEGLERDRAQLFLPRLTTRLRNETPALRRDLEIHLLNINEAAAPTGGRGQALGFVALLAGAVGLALVIACLNVANLLAARADMRRHEIGLRAALGSGRARLVRQLLTESLLLAALSGTAGLLLVIWGLELLTTFHLPGGIPIASLDLGIDLRLAAAAFALALTTGLGFGLLPALHASRPNISSLLSAAPTTSGRAGPRDIVVGVQVALSVVLLVGAVTLVTNMREAVDLDLGFDPAALLSLTVDPGGRYDGPSAEDFYLRLRQETFLIDGVAGTGLTTTPFGNADIVLNRLLLPARGRTETAPITVSLIDESYLSTLGTPLIAGRGLLDTDSRTARPVALISQSLARAVWPDTSDLLGQRFQLARRGPAYTIVGVVQDHRFGSADSTAPPHLVYLPLRQGWDQAAAGEVSLIVRQADTPPNASRALLDNVVGAARTLEPALPRLRSAPLENVIRDVLAPQRWGAAILGFFSLEALFLAAIGIFGVVAYAVHRRTREIGVRKAFGASEKDVMMLFVVTGLKPVAIGVAIGFTLSLGTLKLLQVTFFDVRMPDPWSLVLLPLVLVAVAVAAAWWPARRASRLAPSLALRHE